RIARIVLERHKLRVSVLKAANVRSEMCPAAVRTQIRMATGAGLIAAGGQIDLPAVLDVTFGAIERLRLLYMMNRPVVTREARRIFRFCGIASRSLHMTRGALRLKHSVRRA